MLRNNLLAYKAISDVEFYQNKTLLQIYFLLVYIVFSKIKYFIQWFYLYNSRSLYLLI
jgi:hypothetical protein